MNRTMPPRAVRPLASVLITALMLLGGSCLAGADETPPANPLLQSKVYLQISPRGSEDLAELFTTLEESVAAGETQTDPVVIVLHGPEALPFLRSNYLANRELVDRAARLLAFDRIEMRMCETWMRNNGIRPEELLPFVETVPFAPEEVERLERDGYLRYGTDERNSRLL